MPTRAQNLCRSKNPSHRYLSLRSPPIPPVADIISSDALLALNFLQGLPGQLLPLDKSAKERHGHQFGAICVVVRKLRALPTLALCQGNGFFQETGADALVSISPLHGPAADAGRDREVFGS